MQETEIARRLAAQERLLHELLAALAPPEEGSGFDDLVETLADLTEAVADMAGAVRGLPCSGCGRAGQRNGSPTAGV
ncbi:hypothetical protein [Methylobacterium sp. D54C]